jgi:hypothetical protein
MLEAVLYADFLNALYLQIYLFEMCFSVWRVWLYQGIADTYVCRFCDTKACTSKKTDFLKSWINASQRT